MLRSKLLGPFWHGDNASLHIEHHSDACSYLNIHLANDIVKLDYLQKARLMTPSSNCKHSRLLPGLYFMISATDGLQHYRITTQLSSTFVCYKSYVHACLILLQLLTELFVWC